MESGLRMSFCSLVMAVFILCCHLSFTVLKRSIVSKVRSLSNLPEGHFFYLCKRELVKVTAL